MDAGIHQISAQDYHRDPAPAPSLSASIAHVIRTQSSRHAWFAHPRLNPHYESEDKSAFDLGACAHAVLLEGEGGIEVIAAADWRTKVAQEARDQARRRGNIPVLAHQIESIRSMAKEARVALSECELGTIDLAKGKAEQTLIWQEDKAWCRARPDWLPQDRKLILDYKSTSGSAEPSAWIRNQMVPLGFDVQAVHYKRGNARTGGAADAQWIFLVQENYAPYLCSFVALAPAMEEIAERKWQDSLSTWKNCIARDQWLGYPRRVAYAEPLSWQIAEHEERCAIDQMIENSTV